MKKETEPQCSFCGRKKRETQILISGIEGHICENCVNQAQQIIDELRERGINVEIVMAPMDDRFMVYILGRGVPPPNNNTLRWCTGQIKIEPMEEALRRRLDQLDGQILMITGVRQGESAIRDRRIEMSCSKDGAECGQGWYQQVLPNARACAAESPPWRRYCTGVCAMCGNG